MEDNRQPLVTIGVPVYNGEAGLARALDALLEQTYPCLEIIISDNGSTDATPEIARHYVDRDPRVKYFRSDTNRGGVWNFNRVFELSRGTYFMWAAHDDRRDPEFVSACVERLERSPGAVLCQSYTAVSVEGGDGLLYVARMDSFEGADRLAVRYRETLKNFPATGIYSLFRASAVRKTRLWQQVIGTDVAFIRELALYGTFVQVPRILFSYCARETWNSADDDARVYLGASRRTRWQFPFVALFVNQCERLLASPLPAWVKCRLFALLFRHEVSRLMARLVIRVSGLGCPENKKEAFGRLLYGRFMANPNLEVRSQALFMTRVCKPQLGWWR